MNQVDSKTTSYNLLYTLEEKKGKSFLMISNYYDSLSIRCKVLNEKQTVFGKGMLPWKWSQLNVNKIREQVFINIKDAKKELQLSKAQLTSSKNLENIEERVTAIFQEREGSEHSRGYSPLCTSNKPERQHSKLSFSSQEKQNSTSSFPGDETVDIVPQEELLDETSKKEEVAFLNLLPKEDEEKSYWLFFHPHNKHCFLSESIVKQETITQKECFRFSQAFIKNFQGKFYIQIPNFCRFPKDGNIPKDLSKVIEEATGILEKQIQQAIVILNLDK